MHTQQPSALQKGAYTLVLIGALNWGLLGLFKWNLVHALLGRAPVIEHAIYILVGLSALVLLGSCTSSKQGCAPGGCGGNCAHNSESKKAEKHECEHC